MTLNTGSDDGKRRQPTARRIKFLLAAVLLVPVAGYFGFGYYTRHASSRHLARPQPQSPNQRPFSGLSHTVSADGRKQFAIRCDAIRIRRAKLGPLRFGLLKQAVIENARIEIFQHSAEARLETNTRMDLPDNLAVQTDAPQEVRFDSFFSPKNLETIGIKGARALSFEPIDIKLFNDERCLWQITAAKAVLESLPLRISFRDRVALHRSTGTVQTRQLTWNLEGGSMDWPEKAEAP